MSLMEFCEVRDGVLIQNYTSLIETIKCSWCETAVESVLALGALEVCPTCFDEAEESWNGKNREEPA